MDKRVIEPYIEKIFKTEIIPGIMEFIRIPNVSPDYDQKWDENGYLLETAKFLAGWVENQGLIDCTVDILKDPERTPFLYIDIPTTKKDDKRTILMYAHMDKQPPLDGWKVGSPYDPKIVDGHLYGRGAADDGYAIFAAVSAIKACQDNKWPLPRIVIIVEGSEESSTVDLEYYVGTLKEIIGTPSLIICLDSGCMDYKRLWVTTNLRGVVGLDLKISVLKAGIHSGGGGGFVPDSFMILRQLLDRIEDAETGRLLIEELYENVPEKREKEIEDMLKVIGDQIIKDIPFHDKTQPLEQDLKELVIRNTWKPTICVTGIDGLPNNLAGNVLRPYTAVKLSVRLPPGINSGNAAKAFKKVLTENPPYNAKIEVETDTGDGWENKGNYSNKLNAILSIASKMFFNNDIMFYGVGGSVPFVKYFNDMFPKSDFTVLGVSGPKCNIHGLDENLDLNFCQKLICCLTYLVSDY